VIFIEAGLYPESLKQWLENTPVKNEIAETLINEQENSEEMTHENKSQTDDLLPDIFDRRFCQSLFLNRPSWAAVKADDGIEAAAHR
jgi:hypothetical protein